MAVLSKIRGFMRSSPAAEDGGVAVAMATTPAVSSTAASPDIEPATAAAETVDDKDAITAVPSTGAVEASNEKEMEMPDEDVQQGVQDAQAMTITWSKWALAGVLLNIWLLYFVNAMQSSILSNLIPFVTSDYETHSLLSVIYVVADAMSAAVYIPLSRILDVWGRAQGFAIMTTFATIGMIMMAACNGLPTFCAAYVFYTIGFGGMTYCVDVITADVSTLRSRGLAYAFTSSPYIITAFAGPKASDDFYYHISWRWGFGCFSIIFPFVAAPLYFILRSSLKKAERFGFRQRDASGRTFWQTVVFYIHEFDIIGVVSFSVGLTVFFLPFDLATLAPHGWGSGYIIAMIVVGLFVLGLFFLYEWRLARNPMFRFAILSDRTVLGACLLDFTYQISYYCWDYYFTSFLQVVNNLTLAEAGYVNDTFDVVSGVLLLFVGYIIRRTGRFRWLLFFAVPLYILAQGLMIYFRRPDQSIGYIVMCQIFISIGGSIFILVEQVAILAAVDHRHVASALALLNVVGTVGDATGATISGAIWTNTFPNALGWYLPAESQGALDDIYEDLDVQLSYPLGNSTRIAIQDAYGYSQTRMLASGTALIGLALIWMFLIRDIDLNKRKQVKGMVF